MTIEGKVHCLFEQSGTFKNQFIGLGMPAEDYDIQDNFGETDHVVDLFSEIDMAYNGEASIFDGFTSDDLLLAFYPCIYFCETSQCAFALWHYNYRKLSDEEKIRKILERSRLREEFYSRLIRLVGVCVGRNLRCVIENPYGGQHYLYGNFLKKPDVIDTDRTRRGDHFKKPTAYWFFNCKPTHGRTYQRSDEVLTIRKSKSAAHGGLCSEERSLITPGYAHNFICDFIIGKESGSALSQRDLFDEYCGGAE